MKNGFADSIRRTFAIARNTVLEAIRNRAFLGMGIAAFGLVVSSIALSSLAVRDQAERVLVDFGLAATSLMEIVIAITMGVILVFKEIDRKTFYLVLPKPIRRSEVIAGKFVGLLGVLGASLLLMAAGWLISLQVKGISIPAGVPQALLLVWAQAALITSVAIFFSSFASPVLSGVFTFGVFMVGSSVTVLQELMQARKGMLATPGPARLIAEGAVAVFPDLSVFNVGKELILRIPVTWEYVGASMLYCGFYCLFFLAIGALVFQRRDFS
ncbi:MAG TPA: ABC transporter permease [Myxococcota bacterium]|nr:ABC transporter permease [Myxococcota bacterium]